MILGYLLDFCDVKPVGGRESSQRLGYFLDFAYLRYGTDWKGLNNALILINLTTNLVEVKSMLWKELHPIWHSNDSTATAASEPLRHSAPFIA
jgi:hypothetical protein